MMLINVTDLPILLKHTLFLWEVVGLQAELFSELLFCALPIWLYIVLLI